jgi:hypothetical protein
MRQGRREWADRVIRDYPDKTDAEKGTLLLAGGIRLLVAILLRGAVLVLAVRAVIHARRHREQGLAAAVRAGASPVLGCAVAVTVVDQFAGYRWVEPLARWILAKLKPQAQE